MKGYTIFKSPYILVEDAKGKHQPIYKEYPNDIPKIDLRSPPLCCPFSNARRSNKPRKKNPVRSGYCEVCYIKYDDYDQHVESAEHREYAVDDKNYRMIDVFIKELLEQQLFGSINYVHSPCERLEEMYSSACQSIKQGSESEIDSLIRFSRDSIPDDIDDVVEFDIILNNINKKFKQ